MQPYIEELNYPLARHCSQGKTGVLVNGRELHYKDLEVLKRRGLPGTPGKAYNVDIDGRIIDVATGNELKCLGRLAPTYVDNLYSNSFPYLNISHILYLFVAEQSIFVLPILSMF